MKNTLEYCAAKYPVFTAFVVQAIITAVVVPLYFYLNHINA